MYALIDLGLEHREVCWPNPVHTLMKLCCLLEGVKMKKDRATTFWSRWELKTQKFKSSPTTKNYDYDEHTSLIHTAVIFIRYMKNN